MDSMKSMWNETSVREKFYGLLLSFVCGQGYFLSFLYGMMFAEPVLKCAVNGKMETCPQSKACSEEYSVDYESSYQNLSLRYLLVCGQQYKIRYAEQIIMTQSLIATCFVILVSFNKHNRIVSLFYLDCHSV
jgi:hypothetical protein